MKIKKIILTIFILFFLTSCFFENKKDTVILNKVNSWIIDTQVPDTKKIIEKPIISINKDSTWEIITTQILNTKETDKIKEVPTSMKIEKNTENKIVNDNIWDKAFWKNLQDFINSLMKNPDILKDIDCSKYEKEVETYCKEKQAEYLEVRK